MTQVLKDKYAGYNTYQSKIERNRKIVIKGLHSKTYFKSIAEELQMLNHQIKTIADITKFDTKQPLPLLLVECESKSNNIDIQHETSMRHFLYRLSKN
jgi:flagellin-like hook-associated protein FlgL